MLTIAARAPGADRAPALFLDRIPQCLIDDRFMLAIMDLALVTDPTSERP